LRIIVYSEYPTSLLIIPLPSPPYRGVNHTLETNVSQLKIHDQCTSYAMENNEYFSPAIKQPTLSLVKALGGIMNNYTTDRFIVVYLSTYGEYVVFIGCL
jgi:hypothetical protein